MDEKSRDRDLDLNIPMVPEMELTVTKVAEGVGEFMKLDIDKIEEIKMALIEACINAIEHSKSEDRRIAITFDIGEEELKIQIADQGKGFDLGEAQKQLQARRDSGDRHRGWGLTIMRGLMDEVEVETGESGTRITMVKRR